MIVIQVPTLSAFPDQNFLPVSEIGGTHSQLTTEICFGKVAVPAVRVMGAMPLELSDTEKAALIALLSATIAADRYPLSPRVRALKRVLDKLAPPPPMLEHHPPPKPPGKPSSVLAKKRRR